MSPLLYILHPEAPQAQRFVVEIQFTPSVPRSTLRFANWTPGSYKIRDYARHVISASAFVGSDSVAIRKTGLDRYTLDTTPGKATRVIFEIIGNDDSVRGAWLDAWRAHFEGATIFPCVEELAETPIDVELRPPADLAWQCATALTEADTDAIVNGFGRYQARHWRDLIDHPILMGQLLQKTFIAGGCEHRFAIAGAENYTFDFDRLIADTQKITQCEIDLMGGTPNERYLFQLRVAPGGGGLEHCNSTLLACSADWLPQADADQNRDYEKLLGLISHEYFHLWNVKRIRPQAVATSDLSREAPFPDLWAYEGVTAYFDDWLVLQAGARRPQQYLQILGESLTRLSRTPGRLRQSLVDASLDAWIRLYQPTSHLPVSTVSYYLKGAMVALALDLELRRHSQGKTSLIAQLKAQYEVWCDDDSALASHALEERCRQVCTELCPGFDVGAFFSAYIYGTADPDFVELLGAFGIQAETRPPCTLDDGGGLREDASLACAAGLRLSNQGKVTVALVEPQSPAEAAALCAGDELLACDGQRLRSPSDYQAILQRHQPGDVIEMVWSHDGLTRRGNLRLASPVSDRWQLTWIADSQLDSTARQLRNDWLGGTT